MRKFRKIYWNYDERRISQSETAGPPAAGGRLSLADESESCAVYLALSSAMADRTGV